LGRIASRALPSWRWRPRWSFRSLSCQGADASQTSLARPAIPVLKQADEGHADRAEPAKPEEAAFEPHDDLQAVHAGLPVLVVSMHEELVYAERALRSGAPGYIMKEAGVKACWSQSVRS